MKKLILVALLAIGVSAVSFAQGGRPPQTPASSLERLKTQITGITPDQETKILAIYAVSIKSSDSVRTAAGDDMQSAFPKMQAVRTAADAKIRPLLTADQQKAFDARPPRGPGGGAPRP